jgi:osmoprotectant transport system permease protein
MVQTIPSLALFGFLIPLPIIGGIGPRSAIVALVLYALLPMVRNTYVGIRGVDRSVREAALAMGMTDGQILRMVELPLAARTIMAGLRVATVTGIGVATVATLIGAGGLGDFIYRGLQTVNAQLILLGAVPAALMALAADYGLGWVEKRIARG